MIYMYIIHKYYCWQIIRTPKCFSLVLNNNQNCLKRVLLKTLVSQRKKIFTCSLFMRFHTLRATLYYAIYIQTICISCTVYMVEKQPEKNLYSCTSCNSSKQTPLDFILNCVQLHIPHESSFQNESIDIFFEYHTRLILVKRSD